MRVGYKKKSILIICTIMLFILLSTINVLALSKTSISIGNVTTVTGEKIEVPIKVENNEGICGATLSICYDDSLVLTQITQGQAWSTLTMTEPGDLTANPFNLVFDGIEEDCTNGVVAYLYFEAMSTVGTYDISVSYKDGDVVNGKLEPLDIDLVNGQVTVSSTSEGEEDGNDDNDNETHDGPIITIGEVTANPNESVDVPVYISGNTGICGATLKITYNDALTLTQITKGNALPSLTMTKPGNMAANPFNLVFDGIEQDTSNGLFFTLTFMTPPDKGIYDITANYVDGDIVDGNLSSVNVLMKTGNITVGNKDIEVVIGDKTVHLPATNETNGNTYIAFYTDSGRLTSLKIYPLTEKKITVPTDITADYANVFCWTNNLKPLCEDEKIVLK